jgi:hypothetical protein
MAFTPPSVVTVKGSGVHFGVGSTSCTAFGTCKIQSTSHNQSFSEDKIADESGFTVNRTGYDFMETATLTYFATGTTGASDVTPTLPALMSTCTIVDTKYTQFAGSWIVDSVATQRTNTGALQVTVNISRHALVP